MDNGERELLKYRISSKDYLLPYFDKQGRRNCVVGISPDFHKA